MVKMDPSEDEHEIAGRQQDIPLYLLNCNRNMDSRHVIVSHVSDVCKCDGVA